MNLERPKIGIGVIIRKGNLVVIQQRKGAHGSGTWSVPGGHMENSETPEQTAKREAKEETGLDISNCRIVAATNDIFPDGKHYITIFVEADYVSGELFNPEPDKILETNWCKLEEMPEPRFLCVKNFLEGKRIF